MRSFWSAHVPNFQKSSLQETLQLVDLRAATVDGSFEIRRENQLRLVIHHIICRVFYIPGGAGFLNHQQYVICTPSPPKVGSCHFFVLIFCLPIFLLPFPSQRLFNLLFFQGLIPDFFGDISKGVEQTAVVSSNDPQT